MKYDIEKVTDEELLKGLKEGRIPCTRVTLGGIRTSS
jgi:hypothetical protein